MNKKPFKTNSFKKFQKHFKASQPAPKFPHLTEPNALRAGESAFKARVPFYSNPYRENPCKSAWIRGFKRAEKAFNEGLKRSQSIQAALPLEEVVA